MQNLKLLTVLTALFFHLSIYADSIRHDFENGIKEYVTISGKAEIIEKGKDNGKALRLNPGTKIAIPLNLSPESTYKLSVYMKTESGADDMTMQISGLGQNDISVSTALPDWTLFEKEFHVGKKHSSANLEFIFINSQGNTHAWIDNILIERTGNYIEENISGIPHTPQREVSTDLGIEMQPDEKIKWMLDDKLGMFIHWGLYAGPAKGEWYMENNGVSPEEYRNLAFDKNDPRYFEAKYFNADKWVDLALKMGARYMCLTTQHHDGYALFESEYPTSFTSMQTHGKDFVKEYVAACRKAGLKVGLYKTLINWRYPGYYDVNGTNCLPNKFGYVTDPSHKENARIMKEELYCQTRELMTRYGKIDHLFWDGGWLGQKGSDADAAYFWESGKYTDPENEWKIDSKYLEKDQITDKYLGLMGMVRKFQPDIVTNIRCGWIGDFTNEEGSGPVKGPIRDGVVEKCFSLSPGWGYSETMENPDKIMPLRDIKRIFSDCMVRNMCCLINIGPDRQGNVPTAIEKRLTEFGEWVSEVSDAIYGTRGGPWNPVEGQYGYTHNNNKLFIYFLGEYDSSLFSLPPVNDDMNLLDAKELVSGRNINFEQTDNNVTLSGISPLKDDITIIELTFDKSF